MLPVKLLIIFFLIEALDFDLICLSTLFNYSCMVIKCPSITEENWLCSLITYYTHLWRVLPFMKDFTFPKEQLMAVPFLDLSEERDIIHLNTFNITSFQYSRLVTLVFTNIFSRSKIKSCLWETTGRREHSDTNYNIKEQNLKVSDEQNTLRTPSRKIKCIRLQQGFQLKIMKYFTKRHR